MLRFVLLDDRHGVSRRPGQERSTHRPDRPRCRLNAMLSGSKAANFETASSLKVRRLSLGTARTYGYRRGSLRVSRSRAAGTVLWIGDVSRANGRLAPQLRRPSVPCLQTRRRHAGACRRGARQRDDGVMSLMIRGSAAALVWETHADRLRTGLRLNPSTVQVLTRCRC